MECSLIAFCSVFMALQQALNAARSPGSWLQEKPWRLLGTPIPEARPAQTESPEDVCLIHLANQMFSPRNLKLDYKRYSVRGGGEGVPLK